MDKKMTRRDIEEKVLTLMMEIWTAYQEYNPDGKYLTMNLSAENLSGEMLLYCHANNAYWSDDGEVGKPLDFTKFIEKTEEGENNESIS